MVRKKPKEEWIKKWKKKLLPVQFTVLLSERIGTPFSVSVHAGDEEQPTRAKARAKTRARGWKKFPSQSRRSGTEKRIQEWINLSILNRGGLGGPCWEWFYHFEHTYTSQWRWASCVSISALHKRKYWYLWNIGERKNVALARLSLPYTRLPTKLRILRWCGRMEQWVCVRSSFIIRHFNLLGTYIAEMWTPKSVRRSFRIDFEIVCDFIRTFRGFWCSIVLGFVRI